MQMSLTRVLFVCRGNLCRSPMAMALFRHVLAGRGEIGAACDSAGYYDWAPFPREAHPFARRAVAQVIGTDELSAHGAKPWSGRLVEWATRIVVAEEWMKYDFPADKVVTLRGLAGEKGDVDDPYGHEFETYVRCCSEIKYLIETGIEVLLNPAASDELER